MHGCLWEPLLGRSHEICLPSRQSATLYLASDDWILSRFCWQLRHAPGGLRCAQGRHRISCQQTLGVPWETFLWNLCLSRTGSVRRQTVIGEKGYLGADVFHFYGSNCRYILSIP